MEHSVLLSALNMEISWDGSFVSRMCFFIGIFILLMSFSNVTELKLTFSMFSLAKSNESIIDYCKRYLGCTIALDQ